MSSPVPILPPSDSLKRWLTAFCDLHELYGRGTTAFAEERWYRQGRGELAQLLLRAQTIGLRPGLVPRKSLRVAAVLDVTLHLADGDRRAMTEDISSAGLCLVTEDAAQVPLDVGLTIRLDDHAAIETRATRVSVVARGNALRIGFRFEGLAPEDTDRLETRVFDCVVATLKVHGGGGLVK
jgi:hypothetical protein